MLRTRQTHVVLRVQNTVFPYFPLVAGVFFEPVVLRHEQHLRWCGRVTTAIGARHDSEHVTWQLVRPGCSASHFLSLHDGKVMNAGMSIPTL